MASLFSEAGVWTWWIIALVLLIAELLVTGIFFIWLGVAAAAVAIVVLFVDMPWQAEVALFAALSVALVLVARPWLRRRHAMRSDQPNLNRRNYNYVGRSYVLQEPIVNGRGRLDIEDTLWDVEGPDLPAGARVRVTAAHGMRLTVEAAV